MGKEILTKESKISLQMGGVDDLFDLKSEFVLYKALKTLEVQYLKLKL